MCCAMNSLNMTYPKPPRHKEIRRPDYFACRLDIPVVVAEIKKSGDALSLKQKDRRKLLHLMKLAINIQARKGVEKPTVVGLLFQGTGTVKLLSFL